ncbi:MAG: mechanosensitive ion channel [bacterium]|nr:mechanosensitive ion channel [bacterium]
MAELRRQVALLRFGNAELHQTVAEKEEAFAHDVLTLLKSGLEISSAGLEAVLSPLREREAALRRQLEANRIETRAAEDGLDRLQRRLETVAEKSSAQLVDLDARSTALQVLRQRALVLEDQLGREELKRRQWEQRARILSGEAGLGEARSWLVEVRGVARDLAGSRSSVEARIADTRKELEIAVAVGSGRIQAPGAVPRNWKERERQLRRLEELYQGELGSITELESFVARVLIDLEGRLSVLSFAEQMDRVAENAEGIWNTELTSVDDQPITVGKVARALLLFVLGFLVSRLLSRMAGRLFSRRRHIDSGAAVAAQGLTFYLLLVVFFLIALDMVNIPLTAFTIAGGALALGVGLGAQNIINNFISGLILLVERPIKVGDICEVDATRGMVEHIGPRSTRVRTFDNIHIIVPNSAFLEKNVINWTLSDNIVRASVDVGVVYGSSTEDVVRVIEEVLEEIDDVLDSPKPQVLFMEFGDNALQFRAYFWIRVSEMLSRIRIASDVRFGIDRVFREAGLTIAFPQRDVHLDATEPIEVRMLPADPENANRPRE